ncbi:MAG: KEOPS complex subunit Cgi121 [Candidatus Natronoplasma sp.]
MYVVGARLERPADPGDIFDMVESYRKEKGVFLQLFDQSKVIGAQHLKWAHQKAEETFEQKSNRADDLEIETLLWASAEWQIQDALDKMGIKDGAEKVAVMIDEEPDLFLVHMGWSREDDILEPTMKKLESFGVADKEINSVDRPYDLVFEKMATSVL